jgi:hypothetical protein
MKALQAKGPLPDQRRTWKREDAYEVRFANPFAPDFVLENWA